MNVLITGSKGLLGKTVMKRLKKEWKVKGIDIKDCDITKRRSFLALLYSYFPKIIINTAAFTDVDGAEKKKELSTEVNGKAVSYMADYCEETGALLVHLSTDYVFPGNNGPYENDSVVSPVNHYGMSKLSGEFEILRRKKLNFSIVRTNVLYGDSGKANFISWVNSMLSEGKPIKVVNDQYNNPCYVNELARFIEYMLKQDIRGGIYHTGCREYLSRYDFTCRFAECMGYDISLITPVSTSELGQKAARPAKGGLCLENTEKLTGYRFRSVDEDFEELKKQFKSN